MVQTTLTRDEVHRARPFRLYVLAKDLVVQHREDGGNVIPAGRLVFLMAEKDPEVPEEYLAANGLLSVLPGALSADCPPDTSYIPFRKPRRLLVAPMAKEREWLGLAQAKTR